MALEAHCLVLWAQNRAAVPMVDLTYIYFYIQALFSSEDQNEIEFKTCVKLVTAMNVVTFMIL